MKIKICWVKGDYEDSILLEAGTIEELRKKAETEIEKRKPVDHYWSEVIE